MFNKLFNIIFPEKKVEPVLVIEPEPKPVIKKERKVRKARKPKPVPVVEPPKVELSDKERATANSEPYISILKVEVDQENINKGSFELDWNDKFVLNLIKAGYKQRDDDTDQIIVDRWFQTVARNIALEIYEQQAADPSKRESDDVRRVSRKDLGNGRTEVS